MHPSGAISLCLLLSACAAFDSGSSPSAEASRLDVATVRSLDLEALDRCAEGVWTPVDVTAAEGTRATLEAWRADRCATTRRLNFLVAEAPGGRDLAVTALLPGTTQFTPAEQRSAAPAVLERVGERTCDKRMVVTTESMGDATEVWTVDTCGTVHRVRVGWDRAAAPVLVIESLPPS